METKAPTKWIGSIVVVLLLVAGLLVSYGGAKTVSLTVEKVHFEVETD